MIGDERNPDRISAPLTALAGAAVRRLRGTARGLYIRAQVRLNLAATSPRRDIVGASVIPTVRYRDVPKAVDWLTRAFGMKVHRVVTDWDGAPRYAELTVGAGMLMVAPIEDTAFGKLMVQPDEIGGVETQVCYLCVEDARAHAARARAAGAVVIIDPDDEANRGRGYSCRDPEGHVWNFGVYDPWSKLQAPARSTRSAPAPWRPAWSPAWVHARGRASRAALALALLALSGALLAQLIAQPDAGTAVTASAQALTPAAEGAPQASTKTTAPGAPVTIVTVSTKADDTLAEKPPGSDGSAPSADRAALEAAEKAAAEARAQLATARGALAKAERETSDVRSKLAEVQSAKQHAEQAAAEARSKLAQIQKAADRARAEAAQERAKRLATLRAALKKRTSVRTVRPRPGTYCYSPNGSLPPTKGRFRLSGFCKG